MLQCWGPIRKNNHRYSRTLPTERPRKPIPPERYGLFPKWPKAFAIPNQEAPTVAEALVTNLFCRFRVPREIHSDQGRKFESRLIPGCFERVGVSKTRTTSLHPQSKGMMERYIRTVEEHLTKSRCIAPEIWMQDCPASS
jgi:hypothetical protein